MARMRLPVNSTTQDYLLESFAEIVKHLRVIMKTQEAAKQAAEASLENRACRPAVSELPGGGCRVAG